MPQSTYGEKVYDTDLCEASIYGVDVCVTGPLSGTISNIRELIGVNEMTGNVIIADGGALVIDCDASIEAMGYKIIIQDGGYLNTRGKRLPPTSAMGSFIIFS